MYSTTTVGWIPLICFHLPYTESFNRLPSLPVPKPSSCADGSRITTNISPKGFCAVKLVSSPGNTRSCSGSAVTSEVVVA